MRTASCSEADLLSEPGIAAQTKARRQAGAQITTQTLHKQADTWRHGQMTAFSFFLVSSMSSHQGFQSERHGQMELQAHTKADAPSRGRTLASAGAAGSHRGSLVY